MLYSLQYWRVQVSALMGLAVMIFSGVNLGDSIQLSTSPQFANLRKDTHKISFESSFPVSFYSHEGCMGKSGAEAHHTCDTSLGVKLLLLPSLFISYSCYACEPRLPLQARESDLHPGGCYKPMRRGNDEEGARVGWAQLWSPLSKSQERDTITADSLPLPIFKHLSSCQLSSMESIFLTHFTFLTAIDNESGDM